MAKDIRRVLEVKYGIEVGELDESGYGKSIITDDTDKCFLCGNRLGKLDRHELMRGGDRQKSKALGLWIRVCHWPKPGKTKSCHDICHIRENADDLRKLAQTELDREYKEGTFFKIFGRNYL